MSAGDVEERGSSRDSALQLVISLSLWCAINRNKNIRFSACVYTALLVKLNAHLSSSTLYLHRLIATVYQVHCIQGKSHEPDCKISLRSGAMARYYAITPAVVSLHALLALALLPANALPLINIGNLVVKVNIYADSQVYVLPVVVQRVNM